MDSGQLDNTQFSVNLSSYTLNSGHLVNPYFPSSLIPSKPANNNPLPPQACHARPTVATLPPPSIPSSGLPSSLRIIHNTNLHIFSVAFCFRSHVCLFLFYSFFRFFVFFSLWSVAVALPACIRCGQFCGSWNATSTSLQVSYPRHLALSGFTGLRIPGCSHSYNSLRSLGIIGPTSIRFWHPVSTNSNGIRAAGKLIDFLRYSLETLRTAS